eukprot:12911769-Prorocentrum_lima.AAC.1
MGKSATNERATVPSFSLSRLSSRHMQAMKPSISSVSACFAGTAFLQSDGEPSICALTAATALRLTEGIA